MKRIILTLIFLSLSLLFANSHELTCEREGGQFETGIIIDGEICTDDGWQPRDQASRYLKKSCVYNGQTYKHGALVATGLVCDNGVIRDLFHYALKKSIEDELKLPLQKCLDDNNGDDFNCFSKPLK